MIKRIGLTALGSWLVFTGLWLDYVRRHWREWTLT
jgi:hypothetical protein